MPTGISTGNRMGRALLLCTLLALPGPLVAQAGPSPSPNARAGSVASLVLKGSRVAGKGRAHVGVWAGLVFGGLAVGGGGYAMLENVELGPSGSGFDLDMGYGGIQIRFSKVLLERLTLDAGALLGAGHAKVRDRAQDFESPSDNFFVAEPEISTFYSLLPKLHLGIAAGYRLAWGVEDLPRVSAQDLSAFTATLFLRVGQR